MFCPPKVHWNVSGKEIACKALVKYLQASFTQSVLVLVAQGEPLLAILSDAPPRMPPSLVDSLLLEHCQRILVDDFSLS
jgi:hypothetical protein